MRSLAIAAAFVALAALPGPAAASPGTYEHASLPPGTDGWSAAVSAPGGWVAVGDATWAGRGLRALFWARNPFSPGDLAEWSYLAPPDTEIVGWRAERETAGLGGGDWNVVVRALQDGRARAVDADVPARDRPWGAVVADGVHAQRIDVSLACGGPGVCWRAGTTAELGVRSAVAVLRDDTAPEPGTPHGDLADERTLHGVARLSVAATDAGGGVYRAVVAVDGTEAAQPPAGSAACRDADPGPERRFAARVPCPLRATVDAVLDTRALADGPHELRVDVEDAAGNRTTVLGPSTRTIANHAPAPAADGRTPSGGGGDAAGAGVAAGSGAAARAAEPARVRAWIAGRGRRSRGATVAYGQPVRIRGTVTDRSGRPAGGTTVTLMARAGAGRWRPAASARSDARGDFAAYVAPGPSRRLAAVAGTARSPDMRLAVRAAVTLRAARHGRWVALAGALRGGHVPARGALVTVQALRRHRWVAVTTARTDAAGRWRGRIAVTAAAAGPATLRAHVPRQPGYPFAAGSGRAVEVLE